MARHKNEESVREAVGIYFGAETLREAIDDLQSSGFDPKEIGLLAGEFTVRQSLGHLYDKVNEFSEDPNAPRTAFVAKESMGDTVHGLLGGLSFVAAATAGGAVVATAGVFGGAVVAAAAGAAVVGAIGALLGKILSQSDAEYLEEQIDDGNLLLFVRTCDAAREKLAVEILSKHGAYDVRIYSAPAVSAVAQ